MIAAVTNNILLTWTQCGYDRQKKAVELFNCPTKSGEFKTHLLRWIEINDNTRSMVRKLHLSNLKMDFPIEISDIQRSEMNTWNKTTILCVWCLLHQVWRLDQRSGRLNPASSGLPSSWFLTSQHSHRTKQLKSLWYTVCTHRRPVCFHWDLMHSRVHSGPIWEKPPRRTWEAEPRYGRPSSIFWDEHCMMPRTIICIIMLK